MRENSGRGEATNNSRDPTLRDRERERGASGEAIHGEKNAARPGDRTSARKHGQK